MPACGVLHLHIYIQEGGLKDVVRFDCAKWMWNLRSLLTSTVLLRKLFHNSTPYAWFIRWGGRETILDDAFHG